MKNWKKFAALAGVVLLLAVFCMPMVFALKGDFSMNLFMASIFTVLFVAVMAYVIWMLFRYLNKKKEGEPMGKISNVIFDVGAVLVKFDWEKYLKSFGFPNEEYEAIADATFRNKLWDERDRGSLPPQEYVEKMAALAPEYEADIRKVMADTGKTITRMPYAETWVKYLKSKGYHLYILSNYGEDTFHASMKKEMPFLPYMDGTIFSYEVKQIKPEPEIYRTLLDRFGLNPGESVFLDDREENCEAARKFGIHAIQFQSFKQAAADLEKLGVK